MTLTSTGLGISTSSPTHKLTVAGTTSHETARVLTTTGNANLRVSTDNSDFAIIGQGGSNRFDIYDNNASATRLSIDASGNLLVGKTSSSTGVAGARFSANGFANVTRDGAECINFNRLTSDGTIIDLRKDSVTVGTIGTNSGYIRIGTGDTHLLYHSGIDTIIPYSGSANRDNAISLGYSGARFKDLHLSNSAFIGGNLVIDGLLKFEDSGGSDRTVMEYDSNDDLLIKTGTSSGSRSIRFQTESSEVARFDANGNLLVGTTDDFPPSDSGNEGVAIKPDNIAISRNNSTALFLDRMSGDGKIIDLRKDNTNVGNIGTVSFGDLYIADGSDAGIKFDGSNNQILPVNSSGSELNNTLDLGKSATKFKDLWLAGTMNANAISISGTGTTTLGGALNVQGNINSDSGAIQVGGTNVITDARNITNIGTISSGAITTSGNLTFSPSGDYYAGLSSTNALHFDASTGQTLMSTASVNIRIDANNSDTNRFFRISANSSANETWQGTELFKVEESGKTTITSSGTIGGSPLQMVI